jgi:hypothetical protein
VAKANRAFLAAAVRQVAGYGIGQFLDVGAGLPTSPNVHDAVRALVPDARVAYVDNDPVVVTHARALLATDDKVAVVQADARDYQAIVSAPELAGFIDPAQPVCVLLVSMLHFMPAPEADAVVAAFRDWVAQGSYLVISVGLTTERNLPEHDRVQAAYGDRMTLAGRTEPQIAALFGDFEIVPPGLLPITEWPVDTPGGQQVLGPAPPAPTAANMLAGIGRKLG